MSLEILQQELSQQIDEYQMKGLSMKDALQLLITKYDNQLYEKGFNRNVKKMFRTKRNLLAQQLYHRKTGSNRVGQANLMGKNGL